MKVFFSIFFFIVVSLIDLAFTPYFTLHSIKPYAIILYIYFLTIYGGSVSALLISAFAGFLYDLFSPAWFGLHVISFSTFSYGVSLLKERIYWTRPGSICVLLLGAFFVRLIIDVPYYAGIRSVFLSIFVSVFPGALINTATGFIVKSFIDLRKRYAL